MVRHRPEKSDCPHITLLHDADVARERCPQDPVVVLCVTAGDVLVDQADRPEESLTAHQYRRGVGRHDTTAHQPLQRHLIRAGEPDTAVVAVLDPDAGDAGERAGVEEPAHLSGELVRLPGVVVVTERDQRRSTGQDARVTGPRQSPGAGVGHDQLANGVTTFLQIFQRVFLAL